MSLTLSSKRHFFQPLLHGFEDDFLIPISFCKYLNVQECEKAMLRSQKGEKLWPVKINGRRFEDGWKQFVKDHDLKIGDFLVFRHDGDLLFNVLVLDSTTCEKEYPHVTAIKEEIQIQEQNVLQDSTTGKQVKTSSSILQLVACEKEYLPITAIKEEQIEIQEQNLPKDSARGLQKHPELKQQADSSNIQKSQLKFHEEVAKGSGLCGWKSQKYKQSKTVSEAKATSSLRLPKHPKIKQKAYSSSPGHPHAARDPSNYEKSQLRIPEDVANKSGWKLQKYKQPETDIASKAKATSSLKFKTEHNMGNDQETASSMDKPYFYVLVFASPVRNRQIKIPRDFAWDNGLATSKCREINIKNEMGKSWTVKTKMNKNGEVFIRDGWIEFVEENEIKERDVFRLELVKEEGKTPLMNYYAPKQEMDNNESAVNGKETTLIAPPPGFDV
ncbi:B3 domain-containing protein REM9-like [Euphorbia lathyris]|uniref:B3 domain-containing protein REM9-like n=1 Tax=Euphorbia lathyris TaxID=212925 RepID=UPI0033142305